MGVMDEQVPGAPPNTTGAPTASTVGTPQGVQLAKLAQLLFGSMNPGAGAPGGGGAPQSTAGIVGGAPPALAPPPPGMGAPGGGTGVPSSGLSIPPASRAMPSPTQMPSNFPNKQARAGAVAKTGIENMSEAIHSFKSKKDEDELAKAKNTWDIYQKAATIDPATGQPVDPYTMSIYKNDPKIIARWEKYLKMDFPRVDASDPGQVAKSGGGGKNSAKQGTPVIPGPPAPSQQDQLKAAIAQQMLQKLKSGQVSAGQLDSAGNPADIGSTALSPKDWEAAMKTKYGISSKALSTKDQKDIDKIDAEIGNLKSEQVEHEAQGAKLAQELTNLGPNDPMRKAQIGAEQKLIQLRQSEIDKNLREAGQKKSLSEFTTARKSVDDAFGDASKELSKMQSMANADRSIPRKALGMSASVSDKQEALQSKVTALSDFKTKYSQMQDDVVNGKITAGDALKQARRGAGLTSDYEIWNGVPQDAPQAPPKELPEGYAMKNADGVDIAVKQGNKWVAP